MKMPLISVIIPTHNRDKFLENALLSVINQTYKNIEIIVVDDDSKDNTKKIVDKLKKKHKIKYIFKSRLPKNPAATRNEGIKRAKGEYIAFLDDDDEWLPEKLERQVEIFNQNKDVGLVYTKYKDVYENKIVEKGDIGCSTVMVKKEILNKIGIFDEKLGCAEDRDLWMRIRGEYNTKFVGKTSVIHKIHSKQFSSNLKEKISSEEYFIRKHFKKLKKEKVLHKNYFNLSSLYIKTKNFKNARINLKKSINAKKNFLNAQVYLIAITFFPDLFRKILIKISTKK